MPVGDGNNDSENVGLRSISLYQTKNSWCMSDENFSSRHIISLTFLLCLLLVRYVSRFVRLSLKVKLRVGFYFVVFFQRCASWLGKSNYISQEIRIWSWIQEVLYKLYLTGKCYVIGQTQFSCYVSGQILQLYWPLGGDVHSCLKIVMEW